MSEHNKYIYKLDKLETKSRKLKNRKKNKKKQKQKKLESAQSNCCQNTHWVALKAV